MGLVDTRIFGAVEAGGTKFVCAVGNAQGEILAQQRIPTRDPASTLASMLGFLSQQRETWGQFAAIGVGSFGPIELDATSPRYGHIRRTPKVGWSDTDIVGPIAREFLCPIGFDTDVSGAALAEHRWGCARDVQDLAKRSRACCILRSGTSSRAVTLSIRTSKESVPSTTIAWKDSHRAPPLKRGQAWRSINLRRRIPNGRLRRIISVSFARKWC